jgi:FMN phosphatase YigB (HAD superfamily)
LNQLFTMAENLQASPLSTTPVKALIFDLMGTCLDWHSTVSQVLEDALSSPDGAELPFNALSWRHAFFHEIYTRFEAGLPQEDIDETHRRTLLAPLHRSKYTIDGNKVEDCVRAWHSQKGM